MQNFTLGKKGISMLFFTYFLLIGSSPIFGQTCPTVTASAQSYCNALSTVSDLQPMGATWYADETSNTPLPSNELLRNGEDYYADSESCTTSRTARMVTVTLTGTILAPNVQDDFFTPCSGGGPYNIADLKEAIDASAAPSGYTLEIFPTRYGKDDAPLSNSAALSIGNYYAGFYDGTNCQSQRKPVRFEPVDAPAPAATSPQTVCEGTTISQLEAEGTNLWYRTETSQPALPDDYVVQNNETYWATQIVPSDGPPCESVDRTPVTVTVEPATFNESEQRFCQTIGEGNNFRMPQVQDLTPQGGTFYAEENSTTPLDPSTVLIDGEDYFNRDNGTDCSQDRITVVFNDTPNAGSTTQTTACENETPFNLVDRINDSQLGEPDRDGTFSPALSTGTQIFNPADYAPGTYTFNYNVGSTSACPADTAVISVEVQEAPNAGPGGSTNVCSNDIPAILADPSQFAGLLPNGITPGGSFSPTLAQLATQFITNPSAPLTTTYSVTNANDCTDSASYTLNVIPSPNAGDDSSVTLSTEQDPVNLFTYIQGNPDTGGTFSPGNANGDLDPAEYTPGTYTFRYTVNSSNECSDFSDLSVTITDEIICPVIPDTTQEFCESISDADGNNPRRPQVRDLMPLNTVWYATATSADQLSPNQVLADEEDYFAGNANGDCPNRERVIVQIDDAPNAGSTTNIIACRNEAPFDIVSRLNPSILGAADAGGTITPALASGTTVFNPAVDPAGQYTYTVQSENGGCADDSAFFNVTITEPVPANAGDIAAQTACSSDDLIMLSGFLTGSGATPGGTFSGEGVNAEGTMFDPSIGPNTDGYTITYTVNEEDTNACVTGEASSTFNITVLQGPNAGIDSSVTLSTEQDPVNLFTYIQGNPETGGTFSPGNANGDLDPSDYTNGDYVFTYTVSSANGCSDSSDLTVTITDQIICPDVIDDTQEFCESISDADGNNPRRPQVRDLMPLNTVWYATATSADPLSPNQVLADEEDYFAGNANGNCPNRERVFVQIGKAPNAGATTNITACRTEDPFDIVGRLNPSILGPAMSGGTVTPAFASGTTVFNPAVDSARQYTYTVQSEFGKCDDDFTFFTITITEPVPANAGDDRDDLVFCSNDDDINLSQFLTNAASGGTFTGTGVTNGIFSPSTTGEGDFTITYTVTDETNCVIEGTSDTATLEITVLEPTDANAGGNQTPPDYCVTEDGDVELVTLLGDEANPFGSFELNGEEVTSFNPSDLGIGEFVITYSIDENDCAIGTDSATITINVVATPETPVADAEQTFCLVNDPTVADLVVTGEGEIIIYEDAELTIPADETSPLVDGADYYAVASSGGNACGSDPVMITVILTDADAPTLIDELEGGKFCRGDNPTVQELINNLNGSGIQIYTSLTGGTALPTTTALEDGVTYFASATNSTTQCESSERRAVEVEVGFCGIPEGFSPNDDGINDEFVIPDIATDFPNYTIQVYNRWGSLVFEGNASTGDWDGLSNQSATLGDGVLPAGVYFYILDYNDGQTQPVQGKVYLSR